MSHMKTQSRGARLVLRDAALRDALTRALGDAGFTIRESGADVLALDAGAAEESAMADAVITSLALDSVAGFSAQAAQTQRSIILVAGPAGPAREALHGGVRALARSLAPGLRVNALAPLHAGETMDVEQAGIAAAYLANAGAVTGQIIEIAAPANNSA
jgi:hypothetical protein